MYISLYISQKSSGNGIDLYILIVTSIGRVRYVGNNYLYNYTWLHHLNCVSKVNVTATHAWASAIYPDIYSCAVTQIDMGVR
jgi:hypothetical protein